MKCEVRYFNLFVASFDLFICQIVRMLLMENLFTILSYLIIVIFIILIFQAGVGTKNKPLHSDGREIVLNVDKCFSEEFEDLKNG